MRKVMRSADKTIRVGLLSNGTVEIESDLYKRIGIEVSRIDPTEDVNAPKDAIYKIDIYAKDYTGSQPVKSKPSEYDVVWVMNDGTVLHRMNRRSRGI